MGYTGTFKLDLSIPLFYLRLVRHFSPILSGNGYVLSFICGDVPL